MAITRIDTGTVLETDNLPVIVTNQIGPVNFLELEETGFFLDLEDGGFLELEN